MRAPSGFHDMASYNVMWQCGTHRNRCSTDNIEIDSCDTVSDAITTSEIPDKTIEHSQFNCNNV